MVAAEQAHVQFKFKNTLYINVVRFFRTHKQTNLQFEELLWRNRNKGSHD